MNELIFRILLGVILAGFGLHRGFYTRRVQHSAEKIRKKPSPGTASRLASLLALPALIATGLYLLAPGWRSWSALPLPDWLRWLGAGIALGGFVLLQWAQEALGINWSDTPVLVKGQELIANDPTAAYDSR